METDDMDIQAKLFFDLIDKDQNGMLSKVTRFTHISTALTSMKGRNEKIPCHSSPQAHRQLSHGGRPGGSWRRGLQDIRRQGK